jgi:U3 small nucleolar RNA-associated protein 16
VGDGTVKQLLETTDVRHDISDNLTLEKEFGAKVPRKKHAALDLEKTSLPEILPEEYLEDSDSMALVLQESLPNNKVMPKKTKFRDLLEKQQKDKRIGSTTYRITKVRNNHLPPKSASQARSIKESWLQGRSGKAINPDRKLISKGFFTK